MEPDDIKSRLRDEALDWVQWRGSDGPLDEATRAQYSAAGDAIANLSQGQRLIRFGMIFGSGIVIAAGIWALGAQAHEDILFGFAAILAVIYLVLAAAMCFAPRAVARLTIWGMSPTRVPKPRDNSAAK